MLRFKIISLGCPKPQWRGDGNCDDENNIESCNYDDGDCCGSNVVTRYCLECNLSIVFH